MRVIAGTARGIRLEPITGTDIRPTLDRVREALFSSLMPYIPGARFLDLYAGTGANGIEALSRGADACVFVDHSRAAHRVQRENLLKARVAQAAQTLTFDIPEDLKRLRGPFDVIFADPPYEYEGYAGLLEGIAEHALLDADGVMVIEHRRRAALPEIAAGLSQTRQKCYGDVALSYYRHAER